MNAVPLIRFEANEWRVTRGGCVLFRARSQRDAHAWVAAHYMPLPPRMAAQSASQHA